jgi:multidrug efflux system membrane fusion protein
LVLEDRPNVLVIPAAALQMGNSGNFVYVVKKDNTVDVRNIPNPIIQGSQLLLDKGLKPGERVVIDGQEKIHAGSKVVVSKGAPAGKGDGAGGGGKGDAGSDGGAGGGKAKGGGKGGKADAAAAADDSDSAAPTGKGKGKAGGKGDGSASGKGKGAKKASGDAAGDAQ